MAWDPVFWLIFFVINIILIALNIYQIVCLSDLEADYLNPYDSSSRINSVVIPEMVVQGVFCALFLVTGNFYMFLLTLPNACYSARLFMKQQHLIDVTEVFRFLDAEKKYRLIKLAFYLILFVVVLIRTIGAGALSTMISLFHVSNEELDIRSSILEF
ncbi:Cornichon [Heracleum sosnowskyi]|uniref:Cornichon n=1 Tax=Heracleum sosnowskyi TaxID=360622 RepID=A0AAD8M393_9APIA|nr:Cornichon [Heracleum sosnowskyi]KAK1386656.1 Cornichon [Heracleum sosnowskyi]